MKITSKSEYHEIMGKYIERFSGFEYYTTAMIIYERSKTFNPKDKEQVEKVRHEIFNLKLSDKLKMFSDLIEQDSSELYKKHKSSINRGRLIELYKHRNDLAHGFILVTDQKAGDRFVITKLTRKLEKNKYKKTIMLKDHKRYLEQLQSAFESMRTIYIDIGII